MYYARVVKTSEMPPEVWEFIKDSGSFIKDGYGDYVVGAFVGEADAAFLEGFDMKSYSQAVKADEWFKSINGGGAIKEGDKLIIEHG